MATKRYLVVLGFMFFTTTAWAADQQTQEWPSVSANQDRSTFGGRLLGPVGGRDVTTNVCQDLCYCTNDDKVTVLENAVCRKDAQELNVCASAAYQSCAKRSIPGDLIVCKTCV